MCNGGATDSWGAERRECGELGLSRTTVTKFRYLLHRGLQAQQARSALEDDEVEADECYQNAGEKK